MVESAMAAALIVKILFFFLEKYDQKTFDVSNQHRFIEVIHPPRNNFFGQTFTPHQNPFSSIAIEKLLQTVTRSSTVSRPPHLHIPFIRNRCQRAHYTSIHKKDILSLGTLCHFHNVKCEIQ